MGVITVGARERVEGAAATARLRQQIADRDEVIVALQHVIRDLRHEIENLHVERTYAAFSRREPAPHRRRTGGR